MLNINKINNYIEKEKMSKYHCEKIKGEGLVGGYVASKKMKGKGLIGGNTKVGEEYKSGPKKGTKRPPNKKKKEKREESAWISFLKDYSSKMNMKYNDVLKKASNSGLAEEYQKFLVANGYELKKNPY